MQCPFYNKKFESRKQLYHSSNSNVPINPTNDYIIFEVQNSKMTMKDITNNENVEMEWEFDEFDSTTWHFIDHQHGFQWSLSDKMFTCTVYGKGYTISYLVAPLQGSEGTIAKIPINKGIVAARLQELQNSGSRGVSDPIFFIWKCPLCKKESIDIIGLMIENSSVTFKSIVEDIKKNPYKFTSKHPKCNCKTFFNPNLELYENVLCVFNQKTKVDIHVQIRQNSSFGNFSVEAYFVNLNGQVEQLSKEQRTQLIGY